MLIKPCVQFFGHMVGIIHEGFQRIPIIEHVTSVVEGITGDPLQDLSMHDRITEPSNGFEPSDDFTGKDPLLIQFASSLPAGTCPSSRPRESSRGQGTLLMRERGVTAREEPCLRNPFLLDAYRSAAMANDQRSLAQGWA